MSLRAWVGLVCAWLLSLAAVTALAQSRSMTPLASPVVVSGNDIGFRIEGHQGTTPVGRLVVRVKGKWVEAMSSPGVAQLASR